MKTLQKFRKNKKGFTLVELLVVLVIMAILAAAIIPSMMGFIDKAKEETASAECRSALLSTDVVVNEYYGEGKSAAAAADGTTDATFLAAVTTIADLGDDAEISAIVLTADTKGTAHPEVKSMTLKASNGTIYNYTNTNGWVKATT